MKINGYMKGFQQEKAVYTCALQKCVSSYYTDFL